MKAPSRGPLIITAVVAVAAAAAFGIYYVHYLAPFEWTDDAVIECHVAPVAAQVPGRVEQLLVLDNQQVKKGDLLLSIDPSDYEAALLQARANLTAARSRVLQANAQLAADQAKVEQEKAMIAAVDAEATRSIADQKRFEAVGTGGVSQSQIDLASAQATAAEAQAAVARNREKAAEAQLGLSQAGVETAAAVVQQGQAAVRQAELNVSYTKVYAPQDGRVTRRTAEQGAYISAGMPLMAIVPQAVWVIANFKETQLTYMHPGNPVDIKVDAYPQHVFKGHVDSIQAGTGARFSLFPPENATGNFIKVVQRVPVKILFDEADLAGADLPLGPGMSVEPEVRVK
jgi:membrane fusion protein (multidrug efflux system)